MGESIEYHCLKCGRVHNIDWGAFFRSPASAEEILSGGRGKQAKRNFENHPGKSAMFTYEVFRCNCGYARSKLVMVIFDDDQAPWSMDPERRPVWHNAKCTCARCGRKMRVMDEPPRRIRCTCGSWTAEGRGTVLFD